MGYEIDSPHDGIPPSSQCIPNERDCIYSPDAGISDENPVADQNDKQECKWV